MYAKGQGAPQDYVQAHKWFSLAASLLPSAGTAHKRNALKARDAAASRMTPEQIDEAQKLAAEWKVSREPTSQKLYIAE